MTRGRGVRPPRSRGVLRAQTAAPDLGASASERFARLALSCVYPFAVAGESFIPAADPQLANGSETQAAVMAYNLPEGAAPLDLRSEVVGPDGRSRPATVSIAKRSDGERGGGRKLLVKFKPEGLTPGTYRLKVAVSGVGGKTFESVGAFEIR